LSYFREYLQRGACSIIQADVARIGGVTPWLKAAHLAEAFNVPICPHFLMELHVGLACATPSARWIEYIPQLDDLTHSGMRIEAGRAVPSNEPGLGLAWNWDAINKMRVDAQTYVVK
jgi:L-alanine-DL-glutamate epimerase-like enolase superfamily enzyme